MDNVATLLLRRVEPNATLVLLRYSSNTRLYLTESRSTGTLVERFSMPLHITASVLGKTSS